jgi:hypothetical protein
MELLQLRLPLVNTPKLNPQLHCSAYCLLPKSLAWTTQKQCYCCYQVVFMASLYNNCGDADPHEAQCSSIVARVFLFAGTYLPSCCITPLFYCCVRVLLSNGCLSGSAALAWSKCATILKQLYNLLCVNIVERR